MKYFIALCLLMGILWSCEEDDICTEGKSPRMFLRFENFAEADSARMDSIFIWRQNATDAFELYMARSKTGARDSALVPLPITEVNEAQFIISPRRHVISMYDTLTVTYQRELEFGSKACGYRVNYLDAAYSVTNHFFVASEEIDTNITDEETPDLLLYY